MTTLSPSSNPNALLAEIRQLIEDARHQVTRAANAGLTMTYWRIGKRLLVENLIGGRGDYGQRILATLLQELTWSHFTLLLPLKDSLAREFYAEMCRVERWSVRALRQKIGGMLFERTALSKNCEEVVRQELSPLRDGCMTPDLVFRDPYLLDFLGLSGAYSEKDLEAAILREMESVLLELKLESFQPAHTGQMVLYLRWLDQHERAHGEEAPIGLILCAGADAEQVELLQLEGKSIRVAEYLVELPPAEVLRERLHRAIEHARASAALPAGVEGKRA